VNPSFEHQPLSIYQEVSLAALDLLGSVIAALFSTYPGSLDRLAVHYACARLRVSLEAHSHLLAQGGVHPFPGAIQAPQAEVVVDGLPGWELMWHKSPSTAATDYVKDSVEDLAQGVHSRASGSSGDRQMRLYVLPLGVGEVGLVCSSDLMPGILPGQCFRTPFQTVSFWALV
jgi:hypothetical protein